MHHVGMAAGSRLGDAGGRREPAGSGGSDALFSWDRGPDASHRNIGMVVGRYQRHAGVMHYFCGSPDASRRNGGGQQTR